MRCETCHGSGKRRSWAYTGKYSTIGYPVELPCRDCDGSGLAHCCDGLRACPDTAADASIGMVAETEGTKP